MSKQSAETLVVHGGGLTPDEKLTPQATQRMDTALSAWQEGIARFVTLSGGHSFLLPTPPSKSEASVMKEYGLQHGIPEQNIAIEDKSLDTIGNVLFTKTKVVMPNNWEHLVVVTSRSHLPRTLGTYRHVFGNDFEIRGIAAPEQVGLKEKVWEQAGNAIAREVLRGTKPGDHEAIRERLFDLVPGYEDGTIPRLAFKSLLGLIRK